jgi:hypothetical protein
MKISQDEAAPTVAVELVIVRPLEDYDLTKIEAVVPRDVDPMLASQGFKDLLDETRAILDTELASSDLEVAQLTGAICKAGESYRPGIWLVLRETGAAGNSGMSGAAAGRAKGVAETLRKKLGLG